MEKLDLYKTCSIRKLVIDYLESLDKGFLIKSSLIDKVCKISWTSKDGRDGLFVSKVEKEFPGKYELVIDIPNNSINFYYYPSLYEASNDIGSRGFIVIPLLTIDTYRVSQEDDIESSNDLDKLFYLLKYMEVWNNNKNNILKLGYNLIFKERFGLTNVNTYYWKWYLHKTFDLSKNDDVRNINYFIDEFKIVIEYLLNNPPLIEEIVYLSLQECWNEEFYESIFSGEFKKSIEKLNKGE